MSFIKLLQSLDDLLFEVAMWVIVVPRTFLRVFFRPRWAQEHVAAELSRNESERFDESLSPVLFWLIVTVLPYLWVFSFLMKNPAVTKDPGMYSMLASLPFEERLIALTLSLLFGQLGFSIVIQLFRKGGFGRKAFRKLFHTQCLCMAPAYLLFLPCTVIQTMFYGSVPMAQWGITTIAVYALSFYGSLAWLVVAETVVVRAELKVGRSKALLIVFGGIVMSLVLMLILFAVVFAGTLLLNTSQADRP